MDIPRAFAGARERKRDAQRSVGREKEERERETERREISQRGQKVNGAIE